jgi:hypothetical protein
VRDIRPVLTRGCLGLEPGDAVTRPLPHDVCRDRFPGSNISLALGKDFKPNDGCFGVVHGVSYGERIGALALRSSPMRLPEHHRHVVVT